MFDRGATRRILGLRRGLRAVSLLLGIAGIAAVFGFLVLSRETPPLGAVTASAQGAIDCPAPLAGYQINDRPEFRGAVALNPGNGTMLATCRYAQPVVIRPGPLQQAATYDLYISWAENEQAVRAICALKDGTFDTLGNPSITRRSPSKAAYVGIWAVRTDPEAALAQVLPLLPAAEAKALPCPGAARSTATASSVAAAASGSTAGDAVAETLVNIFAASDLVDSKEFWTHFTSRTGREPHPKSIQDDDIFSELYEAVGRSPEADRIIPPLAVTVALAATEDGDGNAVFPSLRAALPVIAQLAANAFSDPASERALSRFTALLVNADLAAAR